MTKNGVSGAIVLCVMSLIMGLFPNANGQEEGLFKDRQYCLSFPRECLQQSEEELVSVQPYTLEWYRIKQNRLSALFQLQQNSQLKQEVAPLVDLEDAPPVFLTTVYTIHSKLLLVDGDTEQGMFYLEKAVSLIKAVNQVSIDPTRYAEVSNLYTYAKDWQSAKEFGLWAQRRLANIKNLVAMASFHTSQGHVYNHFEEYKQAAFHYGMALKGYLQKGNAIHCAVGYHNLARVYQKTGKLDAAILHFNKAIEWSDIHGEDYDGKGKIHTQLRLTQAYISNGQLDEANKLFTSINRDIMPYYFDYVYAEVESDLKQANDKLK